MQWLPHEFVLPHGCICTSPCLGCMEVGLDDGWTLHWYQCPDDCESNNHSTFIKPYFYPNSVFWNLRVRQDRCDRRTFGTMCAWQLDFVHLHCRGCVGQPSRLHVHDAQYGYDSHADPCNRLEQIDQLRGRRCGSCRDKSFQVQGIPVQRMVQR